MLVVRAPYRASMRDIEDFMGVKKAWIDKAREKATKRRLELPQREFRGGEEFMYLGLPYKLKVEHGGTRALVFDGAFILSPDHAARAREFFTGWYREAARSVIEERARLYASKASLSYSGIRITAAKRTWGSCARRGTLSFSWRLVMAPPEIIDYVIVHELAHLAEMNHSRRFWEKVESLLPDYRERRSWLKENGHMLVL